MLRIGALMAGMGSFRAGVARFGTGSANSASIRLMGAPDRAGWGDVSHLAQWK
jgi:hypothetical protein